MTPAPQLSPVDRVRRLPRALRALLYRRLAELGPGALAARRYDWPGWLARPDQLVSAAELEGKDLVIFTGIRGVGKTEAAINFWAGKILDGTFRAPILMAATEADVAMLAKRIRGALPPSLRPEWVPSSREAPAGLLRFHNGVTALGFAAAAPESVVGQESDGALLDDLAKWGPHAETAYFHVRTATRKGAGLAVLATTRRGTRLLRQLLLAKAKTPEERARALDSVLLKEPPSGAANDGNLTAGYRTRRAADLGDTALYGQELGDEDDQGGSPFASIDFVELRIEAAPPLVEIVVMVDPATSSATHSCEVGVVAVGIDARGTVYGLRDKSAVMDAGAKGWPAVAVDLYEEMLAEHPRAPAHLGVEINKGGNMGPELVRAEERNRRLSRGKPGVSVYEIRVKTAKISKTKRGEPIARLAKSGQLRMLPGLAVLEGQLRMLSDDSGKSDRADAFIWGALDLAKLDEVSAPDDAEEARAAFAGFAEAQARMPARAWGATERRGRERGERLV